MSNRVVNVFRGDVIESSHGGHCAVVDSAGKILYKIGDTQTVTYLRSSAKPFQTIPLVESGAAQHFKLTSEEIAIIAGSHNGEPRHVEVVNCILEKIGLNAEYLQCGVHIPHYYTANNIKPKPDEEFLPVQHNCSGKHAGMLALCVFKNLPLEDYLNPEHPVQELITDAIAYVCDYPRDKIGIGIDGCSAPVHAMPIYNMALGFAHFVTPHAVPREKAKIYTTITQAMIDHPDMVAGTGRYDYDLMVNCAENMVAKSGAEGLHCMGLSERGWGIAAKIGDGARRALYPFSVEILRQLGVVTAGELEKIKKYHIEKIYNWTDKEVGYIKPDFEIERL